MALITKSDIPTHIAFTQNIPDRDIDPHIAVVQEFEFKPRLPSEFYDDLTGSLTSKPELQALLNDYVKAFLCYASVSKYLLWSGRKITQAGIMEPVSNTERGVTDKGRAELIADVDGRKNITWSRLINRIAELNYTFDGVTYNFSGKPEAGARTTRFKIWRAGGRK